MQTGRDPADAALAVCRGWLSAEGLSALVRQGMGLSNERRNLSEWPLSPHRETSRTIVTRPAVDFQLSKHDRFACGEAEDVAQRSVTPACLVLQINDHALLGAFCSACPDRAGPPRCISCAEGARAVSASAAEVVGGAELPPDFWEDTYLPATTRRDLEAASPLQTFLFPDKEELPDDVEMSVWDHLEELRQRVFVSVGAVGACILLCFVYANQLVKFLEAPVASTGVRFLQLSPGEYFFVTLKVSAPAPLAPHRTSSSRAAPPCWPLLWARISVRFHPAACSAVPPCRGPAPLPFPLLAAPDPPRAVRVCAVARLRGTRGCCWAAR